ncbi:hypothetical protein ZIOFF_017933 [Zingiber officinale]|uniref:Uncharacterized protein n=1 Tax=Zingiber officinale TaxID=94328 RepID=A0A8J5HCD4_ZINOF|nr:hypothetical protein ZIOFF_017933 [Zingiber officinale]
MGSCIDIVSPLLLVSFHYHRRSLPLDRAKRHLIAGVVAAVTDLLLVWIPTATVTSFSHFLPSPAVILCLAEILKVFDEMP